ncbi:endonuclease [Bizionia myxarmorum]|uniref:T9SS type A sorting domain-containing protein n=1 Tax=Bizionia myxarmorum TaxID=291186 RepID=A0A5D0R912_9FLAO|nr:endonuclease [Bizionia myxarmorum]TYB77168.1 T9SS type A sorting domain-containing protein [Bizionia myxarmorum]
MKQIYFILALVFSLSASAQIPAGYYNSATGTGYALKTQLKNITANGHTPRSYDQLYDGAGIANSQGYVDTHSDVNVSSGNNYENDGTVLDFYSENPNGPDPYNFTHNVDEGGNQNSEGDCYNREHLIPQSSFSSGYPMQSDIHHVIPTDCRVNNYRGSFPFGNVAVPNLTSLNGSKRGSSAVPGYSGTMFEPIDEFKGDIARALLYFATRYEDTVDGYTSFDMFNGSNDQVFFPWAVDMLLDWHYNVDPVDQRERDRNNAAYKFQGNANPFVDHPEYANMIWNPNPDTEAPTAPTNLVASNPTDNSIYVTWTSATDNIGVTSYDIYVDGVLNSNATTSNSTVTGLLAATEYCFTIKAKDAAGNQSGFSNQACETTTDNGTGTDCLDESFENIPTDSPSSYTARSWIGDNGGTWSATDARTDQNLNNKAIAIRDGVLTAPTSSGGIGVLTVTTKRVFGGSAGTFNLKVNGTIVGTIAYGEQDITQTVTTPAINIEGTVSIVIDGNSSTGNRVIFDDLSWTCYSNLSTDDFSISKIDIYPNPVKNSLNIKLLNPKDTQIDIYTLLGKKVLSQVINKTDNTINTESLSSGVYIIRLQQDQKIISKKLIKK